MSQENAKPTPEHAAAAAATPAAPTVWQLKKKQKERIPLTEAERAIIREYESKYRPSQISIYVPPKQLEIFQKLADGKGVSFSEWMVDSADLSLQDKTPRERDLDDKLMRVTAERDNLRLQVGQLATENAEATRRERNHADTLRGVAQRLARLPKVAAASQDDDAEEEAAT